MAAPKHLELDEESASIIAEALDAGDFQDARDVVREALKSWRAAEERLSELRDWIEEGAASGPAIPAEEVFAELEARYRAWPNKPA